MSRRFDLANGTTSRLFDLATKAAMSRQFDLVSKVAMSRRFNLAARTAISRLGHNRCNVLKV